MAAKTAPYSVYHSSEAGAPELHEDGWYFQPTNWDMGEIFSDVYATREDALDAAAECRSGDLAEAIAQAKRDEDWGLVAEITKQADEDEARKDCYM